jgi:hypothetical protein
MDAYESLRKQQQNVTRSLNTPRWYRALVD